MLSRDPVEMEPREAPELEGEYWLRDVADGKLTLHGRDGDILLMLTKGEVKWQERWEKAESRLALELLLIALFAWGLVCLAGEIG